jgi:hypothetical protein
MVVGTLDLLRIVIDARNPIATLAALAFSPWLVS